MPCKSYDDDWRTYHDDEDKIKELKKQVDVLARIACKALTELEDNKIEDVLLLRDDEVRVWWQKHKEDDRKAREALEAKKRQEAIKKAALAKLSDEEKVLLGLEQPKRKRVGSAKYRVY